LRQVPQPDLFLDFDVHVSFLDFDVHVSDPDSDSPIFCSPLAYRVWPRMVRAVPTPASGIKVDALHCVQTSSADAKRPSRPRKEICWPSWPRLFPSDGATAFRMASRCSRLM
jgi:hypothetical protein